MNPWQKLKPGQLFELLVSLGAITHLVFFVHDNWKYPHEIAVFTGLCLLLTTIVVFNPASFIRRAIRRVAHIFEPDPFIAWFVERDAALPDMQRVWKTKAYLGFVGLSHRSLPVYFANELSSNRSLPWQSIDIFFASTKVGTMYEGAEFESNMRHSRQLIAEELTTPGSKAQLSNLTQIRFQQMDTVGAEYTGSIYGPSRENPETFYVVLSSPVPRGETKKALTFRVDRDGTETWNSAHRAVLEHYEGGFDRIQKHSTSLGTFRPSIWDQSAADWSIFCLNSQLMSEEMSGLIAFAGPLIGKNVLDLGCGSGEMSKQLLRAGVSRLTALDQSAQMLRLARQQLGDASNVHYALCSVPARGREDLDFAGQKFDLIVLHQVLPTIAANKTSLTALARWCLSYLTPGGTVVLAAHDSIVELERSTWVDPFRTQLNFLFNAHLHTTEKFRRPEPKLRKKDIHDAFADAGFLLDKFDRQAICNTMSDRSRMWSVPAILDSFVDINLVGLDTARGLSRQAAEAVQSQETKDRIVGYWLFVAPYCGPPIRVEGNH